jgi:hypothetical protein
VKIGPLVQILLGGEQIEITIPKTAFPHKTKDAQNVVNSKPTFYLWERYRTQSIEIKKMRKKKTKTNSNHLEPKDSSKQPAMCELCSDACQDGEVLVYKSSTFCTIYDCVKL